MRARLTFKVKSRGGSEGTSGDAEEYKEGMTFMVKFYEKHKKDDKMVSYIMGGK